MKDYLVVLTGSPRGGEVTWNYLYKNVLDVLDADLALCTTDKFLENNSLFQKQNLNGYLKSMMIFLIITENI